MMSMSFNFYIDMIPNKNILVTTTTFPNFSENDPTPTFVYELSRRIAHDPNFRVVVSAPFIKDSKEFEMKENLKIFRFKYGFTSLREGAILPNIKKNKLLIFQVPFYLFFSFLSIVKLVRKEKIDIIHAHLIVPQGFLAVLYKKLFRKKDLKILCTVHGGDIFSLRGKIMTRIKKWTLENVDEITVVSEEIKKEIKKIGVCSDNVAVMPMGVDDEIFRPEKSVDIIRKKYGAGGPLFLFVGRLVEKKGLKYAISSMAKVLKKYPKAKLLVIGTGPLEEDLKKQTEEMSLQNNVIFAGGISNSRLPEYYAAADLFLGPSVTAGNGDSEGFGLVFVEAMLCGCAVIASDLEAISDIIEDGRNGMRINVKDADLFADRIIDLISDEEKRKEMAGRGYETAKEKFTWKIAEKRYIDLLNKL